LPGVLGPFSVIEEINKVAMKLDPPNKLRMHDVFHVSLLRPYIEGKFPRSPPIPLIMDGENEFVVDRILEHDLVKVSSKKTQLENLIKWVGYTDEHNKWETMDSLTKLPRCGSKVQKVTKVVISFRVGEFCMDKQGCKIAEKNVMRITTPRRLSTLSQLQVG
jgi:hypothetical protein